MYRSREPNSRGDRYMLVSYDEPPHCIKAGWKTNNAGFISQLKNLQATSLSTFGRSMREAFDLLNIHRLHTSIDHYGQGRIPFYMECAVIIAITDGGKLSQPHSVEQQLNIVGDSVAQEGSELTNQPFRWDQRLFTVLLRLSGIGEERNVVGDVSCENNYLLGEGALTAISELTGGRSYVVTNQKSMVQCMESLTQKLQPGVVLNFQKIRGNSPLHEEQEPMEVNGYPQNGKLLGNTDDGHKPTPPPNGEGGVSKSSSTAWYSTRRMIYVKTANSTPVWPVPESFWPDNHTVTLPSRDIHPIVWFDTSDVSPMLVEKFPFDKYELEPSPLTQCILAKRNSNVCWQVFIKSSGKQEGLTYPFGYLKASTSLTHVTLFVMPFNYPILLPLAEELLNNRLRPSSLWRQKFSEYVATVPCYYAQPLRKAFSMMGAPSSLIFPETFDGQMSYSISNYLRKLKKQAKLESERMIGNISKSIMTEVARRPNGIVDLGDGITLAIGSTLKDDGLTCQSFRNPYDISRRGLLGQLSRMRTNFIRAATTTPNYIDEVLCHQVPIGQMGNYQEHLKKVNPLREVDEAGGLRTQLFGNPYKLERSTEKQAGVFADEHMVDTSRKSNVRGEGRKKTSRVRSLSKSVTPPPSSPISSVGMTSSSSVTTTTLASSMTASSSLPLNTGASSDQRGDKSSDSSFKEPAVPQLGKESGTPPTKGDKGDSLKSQHLVDKDASHSSSNSLPEPFKSSSLPEEKSNHHALSSSLNRKRERSPSPTTYLNSKRPAVQGDGLSSRGSNPVSQLLLSRGNSLVKPPSSSSNSVLGSISGGGKVSKEGLVGVASSASRVLTEEIQKQEGQENGRLKNMIIKEVRKPGKSYDAIFQHLENVRGSMETKDAFACDIIKEAGKFKKKKLVQELEEWRTNLKSGLLSHLNNRKNKLPPLPAPPPVKR